MVLLALPTAAVALISLAAFFGQWVWWLDVLANFRAQYVPVLAVAGLILAVVKSRWRIVGYGLLAVAALNLVTVLPLYLGSPGEEVPGSPTLRVLSFNLLSDNESYSSVVDYIGAVSPDVVLLHEASRPWEVAVEAADLGYEIVRARSEDLIFGTLALVRGTGVEAVSYGFSESDPRAIAIRLRPLGWSDPVSLLGIHPLAPTEERRARLRDAQLLFASDWATGREGHLVVVGDFNATPWSWAFRSLVDESGLANSQRGFGLQASFPVMSSPLLRVPIDHLLHSDSLEIVDRRLGPALGSDHFPLVVDLRPARRADA